MELKPTFLAGVPRVLEKNHEGVLKGLEEVNPRRRKIFHLLYNYKLRWMKAGYKQKYASPLADLLAFRKVKNRPGGRIRLIVYGGAPLSSEVEEFLRVTSCAFVLQGYVFYNRLNGSQRQLRSKAESGGHHLACLSGSIPTALDLRNVAYGDVKCLACNIIYETTDHLLVECSFARSVT